MTIRETDPNFAEKRSHKRKLYVSEVNYAINKCSFKDFIRDISAYGVFISTNETFNIGQELDLALPLPNNKKKLDIKGVIARISPEGIGVKFKTLLPNNTINKLEKRIK